MPIHPDYQKYLVMSLGPNCNFIDKVLPWGLTNAAGIEGEVADAICDILKAKMGVPHTAKWVNDFQHSREPTSTSSHSKEIKEYTYAYDLSDLLNSIKNLGVPWSEEKSCQFDFVNEYIRFEWDARNRTVSLSPKKLNKYRARIRMALTQAEANQPFHFKDVVKVHRTLMHITFVVRQGRPFL